LENSLAKRYLKPYPNHRYSILTWVAIRDLAMKSLTIVVLVFPVYARQPMRDLGSMYPLWGIRQLRL
jgi:hypothetical protein